MAKETKIGLIAGLGFIVCFAVILTNRGRQDPLTTHRPYLVDRGDAPQQAPGMSDPVPSGASTPTGASRGGDARPAGRTTAPVRIDRMGGPGEPAGSPASGADIVFRDAAQSTSEPPRSVPSGKPFRSPKAADARRPFSSAAMNPQRGAPPSPDDLGARRRLLQEMVDAVKPPPRGSPGPGSTTSRKSIPRRARPAGQGDVRYAVSSGDTLYKIAARQYGLRRGSDQSAVVKAIFAANRSVMPKPDVLRMGVELRLPVVQGHRPRRSTQSTPSAARTTGTPRTQGAARGGISEPQYVWYQIRKNDRYVTIARDQLHDATRWREIYELNKDKFPQAGRIREGVRIKLPAFRVADAQGRRR